MKVKLIKTGKEYLLKGLKGETLAISSGSTKGRMLSLSNCQAIERGYDLEELAASAADNYDSSGNWHVAHELYKEGFQKALETLGDKKFSEEELKLAFFHVQNEPTFTVFKESLQQTEWYCIVFVDDKTKEPLLDNEGNLILKRR